MKLNHEEFIKRLSVENPTVHVLNEYESPDSIMECCCNFNHKWKTDARNLLWNKTKCPYCCGRKTIVGTNDLWTTDKHIAELLLNKEDGYKYKRGSDAKVKFVCPDCGTILEKKISNIVQRGLSCNNCSANYSFPNRFMHNLLIELGIDFIPEYSFKESKYRYDFYIPKLNIIIEMNGKQHYYGWNDARITVEQIQDNDYKKMCFAKDKVNDYIVIDCRDSRFDILKENVINSILSHYFNLNNLNWNNVQKSTYHRDNIKAIEMYNSGMSIKDISKTMKKSDATIRKWLYNGNDVGLCNYIPSEGNKYKKHEVILVNNKMIFNSISDACNYIKEFIDNKSSSLFQNISACCMKKNGRKFCGYINGIPLIWRYLEDYDEKDFEKIDLILKVLKESNGRGSPINIYDINNNYINTFPTIKHFMSYLGIKHHDNNIKVALNNNHNYKNYNIYYAYDPSQPDKDCVLDFFNK